VYANHGSEHYRYTEKNNPIRNNNADIVGYLSKL
jgi:hypothetical protein